ncbi:TPM domain-containing protein [Flavisphingomonas formosensis]|uniref:TPM domain-containing protein n=1 Tax=Flavisphingomonas formosensis TaxID=861534 RepID=UPI0012FC4A6B|nr:TPM domain-containing protein [Sphingomonas formosensis]
MPLGSLHARTGLFWPLLLLLCFCAVLPAQAQTFPPLTGHVVDQANILTPEQRAALDARLQAQEKQSGHQLVVATIADLQGYPIEDYGYRLGRSWAIGQKGLNDGLILIVAPKDRRVRIEVGYGLEPVVTDALSSVIINSQIVPAFKAGDMAGGINAAVDALSGLIKLPPDQAQARAKAMVDKAQQERGGDIPFSLIFWGIVLAVIVLSMLRRRAGGQRYGGGPIILWGPGSGGGWGGGSGWSGGGGGWGGGDGGGFSGGGGSFGGGGASGGW